MNRYRGLNRRLMFYGWAILVLAAFFTSLDGVFGLGVVASRILVRSLWTTCCVSSILAVVFDRPVRIVAAAILLSLLTLFLPTL